MEYNGDDRSKGAYKAMGDKHLAEVIDYKRDIEPYSNMAIFSGVGSGKNRLIEKIITGTLDSDLPKQNVLLITSRKAKVEETAQLDEKDVPICKYIGRNGNMNIMELEPDEIEAHSRGVSDGVWDYLFCQKSVVCTNAFIERYLQYRYRPTEIMTHLWERFDMIVIDEVHSMVLDATYQSAPFYIFQLVKEYVRRQKQAAKNGKPLTCKHLIIMTGTPKPIEHFKPKFTLNKFDECINVMPKNVRFIELEKVKEQIEAQLEAGERIVYFANHTITPADFCEDTEIDPDVIAVSFSKKERRDQLKKTNRPVFEKMEQVEKSIMETQLIPDDVHLLLTTSRNKEGINIQNKDIRFMYVESHNRNDVIQMAGRIRKGVDTLYIIVDSQGYPDESWKMIADFSKKKMVYKNGNGCWIGAVNEYYKGLCEQEGQDEIYNNPESEVIAYEVESLAKYIDYIHETFPFVRYNYFTNIFEYYAIKETGHKEQDKNNTEFKEAGKQTEPYKDLVQEWFPEAVVYPYVSKEEQARIALEEFLGDDKTQLYPEADVKAFVEKIKAIFDSDTKSINSLMGKFTNATLKRAAKDKSK